MDPTTLEFTPLRISTLVTTGHLGTTINLANLFKQIKMLMIPIGYAKEGILKMEHETNVIGYSARDLLTKRRVSDKTFFNQSTIVVRKLREAGGEFKEVNVKLFANGGFQMTGVTNEEFSRDVIHWLIKQFNDLPEAITEVPLTLKKFAVQLLNSDYKVNALVKRSELHKILCDKYHLSSTLETTIQASVGQIFIRSLARLRSCWLLLLISRPRQASLSKVWQMLWVRLTTVTPQLLAN
jgi:hypothetical protein